jgi:hypothetical protein
LPAFCRTRRPILTVSVNSLQTLYRLLLLVLLFQLSTLLLVIAGPVPPRLPPATVTNHFRPDPDANSALTGPDTTSPISAR